MLRKALVVICTLICFIPLSCFAGDIVPADEKMHLLLPQDNTLSEEQLKNLASTFITESFSSGATQSYSHVPLSDEVRTALQIREEIKNIV